jgi:hypothetical protein
LKEINQMKLLAFALCVLSFTVFAEEQKEGAGNIDIQAQAVSELDSSSDGFFIPKSPVVKSPIQRLKPKKCK